MKHSHCAGLLVVCTLGSLNAVHAQQLNFKPLDLRPLELKPLELKPLELKPSDLKPTELKQPDVEQTEIEKAQSERQAERIDFNYKWTEGGVGASCEEGKCRNTSTVSTSTMALEELQDQFDREKIYDKLISQQDSLESIKRGTQKALEFAKTIPANDIKRPVLDVTIYLREQPFDFQQLRAGRVKGKEEFSKELLAKRKSQLASDQGALREVITELGGSFGSGRALSNTVTALMPPNQLEQLLEVGSVIGFEINERDKRDADGVERRLAMGLPAGGIPGIDGGAGSTRSNDTEVKFGVIEFDNDINLSHRSFADWAGGPNRIVDTDTCKWRFIPPGRQCVGSATTSSNSHGTNVTSVLASSLEQGQDSTVTGTNNQRTRSGINIEGHVHYYSYKNRGDLAEAIEEASEDNGVDIINLSASPTGIYCRNSSLSGVRSQIESATDAGILMVVSAGNDADDLPAGACSVNSYATMPDSLAVGATDDVSSFASTDTVDVADYSGRGSFNSTLSGGDSRPSRLVDLIVTGDGDQLAGSGASGTASSGGTSFASPQVAAAAGLLKHWIDRRGSFDGMENDPYAIRTLLSVMGDGSSSVNGGGTGYGYSISRHSGFGHLRYINLDTDIGSGGWGLQRRPMNDGAVVEWPVGSPGAESSAVQGWKFVALLDVNRFGDSPDVKYELIDRCPIGGGVSVIRTAARYSLKARMRMRGSEMANKFHGKCLFMRATVESASGSFMMYTADYFYTNDRSRHDIDN